MAEEHKNAIIDSITISNADHGCLTIFLYLKYGNNDVQGFGGYSLFAPGNESNDTTGQFMWKVLECAGVRDWNRVVGKALRVIVSNGLIKTIGHITEDKWFTPSEQL